MNIFMALRVLGPMWDNLRPPKRGLCGGSFSPKNPDKHRKTANPRQQQSTAFYLLSQVISIRCVLVIWALCLFWLATSRSSVRRSYIFSEVENEAAPSSRRIPRAKQGWRAVRHLSSAHKLGRQKCDESGCTCEKGYTGPLCEEAVCEQGCGHGKCLRPSYCTCEDGWKGRNCEEPVCNHSCGHGACEQPDFCKCEDGWFGSFCDRRCGNGNYSYLSRTCECQPGWDGIDCSIALCESIGCFQGTCVEPDICRCQSGWSGANCSHDEASEHGSEILRGLNVRLRAVPHVLIHLEDDSSHDSWRFIRKWTSHLADQQWRFGRRKFMEEVPPRDVLFEFTKTRVPYCAAVGGSSRLMESEMGTVIDSHPVVLRFNNAPTKDYEAFVGFKTTHRLLNKKWGDYLMEVDTWPLDKRRHHVGKRVMNLMWRAEAYHYYPALRRKFSDEQLYLIAPEILIPTMNLYKTATERMQLMNITWDGVQAAPNAFVGVALLMQICKQVDLFGFEPPAIPPGNAKVKFQYYEKPKLREDKSTAVEWNLLRALDAFGAIRLCSPENYLHCYVPGSLVGPNGRSQDSRR